MTTNKLIIEERQKELDRFLVGRLLPFRKKRSVGPFVFIDHMGPAEIKPDHYFDIDQHPHIGLSTLTYLLEGEIEHRDSTGAVQIVKPGDVGFMTAGEGVTHTERTPQDKRDGQTYPMHGYQVWVALPKDKEKMKPRFDFLDRSEAVTWQENGIHFQLVAGQAFGKSSPLPVHSPLFMVHIKVDQTTVLDLRNKVSGEIGVVVVKGEVHEEGETIGLGQMMISKTRDVCELEITEGSEVLLFGGEPYPEERYLLWNFASSDKDVLHQAKQDWIDRKFPKVPGDETYIQYPV